MQLISAVFLISAIVIIRKFLVANGVGQNLNERALFLHIGSFVLYIASVIVFDFYYWVYISKSIDERRQRHALLAWILTTYTLFVAQAFLIVILFQFGSTKQEPEVESQLNPQTQRPNVESVHLNETQENLGSSGSAESESDTDTISEDESEGQSEEKLQQEMERRTEIQLRMSQ